MPEMHLQGREFLSVLLTAIFPAAKLALSTWTDLTRYLLYEYMNRLLQLKRDYPQYDSSL